MLRPLPAATSGELHISSGDHASRANPAPDERTQIVLSLLGLLGLLGLIEPIAALIPPPGQHRHRD